MGQRVTKIDNEWQRVATSDTMNDSEWQQMSMNDNEWCNKWERIKANENKQKRVLLVSEWKKICNV